MVVRRKKCKKWFLKGLPDTGLDKANWVKL